MNQFLKEICFQKNLIYASIFVCLLDCNNPFLIFLVLLKIFLHYCKKLEEINPDYKFEFLHGHQENDILVAYI